MYQPIARSISDTVPSTTPCSRGSITIVSHFVWSSWPPSVAIASTIPNSRSWLLEIGFDATTSPTSKVWRKEVLLSGTPQEKQGRKSLRKVYTQHLGRFYVPKSRIKRTWIIFAFRMFPSWKWKLVPPQSVMMTILILYWSPESWTWNRRDGSVILVLYLSNTEQTFLIQIEVCSMLVCVWSLVSLCR